MSSAPLPCCCLPPDDHTMTTAPPSSLATPNLFPFPVEILLRILYLCTPATLARCCLVSHELLVLASEPLWTDVVLTRPDQLRLLFRVGHSFFLFYPHP